MNAAVEPKANLPALTGIRGIAAWFVVLYHIRGSMAWQVPAELTSVLAKGYLAVDFFFMLSGFVLWLNYSDRLRSEGAAAVPGFLRARIARIWPLHLAMLAGAAAFALLIGFAGRPNPVQFPWSELPLHILLIQNWGFTDALSWNDPAWSISCELAAYLLFPLLVMTADWRSFSSRALIGLLALAALALHLAMSAGGAPTIGTDIPRFGLLRALCEFAMGTIVCALWLRWRSNPKFPALASLAIAAAITPLLLAGIVPETLGVPLLFAAILLLVSLTGASTANPLGWRPVHYVGEISYATYLVHYLLFIGFKLVFVEDAERVPLPMIALFLMMTLVASIALHHGLEKPAQRRLNRALSSAGLILRKGAATRT
jgi:peptidoglycan/LPS O-acetylase OafA/YrhL